MRAEHQQARVNTFRCVVCSVDAAPNLHDANVAPDPAHVDLVEQTACSVPVQGFQAVSLKLGKLAATPRTAGIQNTEPITPRLKYLGVTVRKSHNPRTPVNPRPST